MSQRTYRTMLAMAIAAGSALAAAEGNFTTAIVGSLSTDKNPTGANWQYTLRLDGKDWTSLGFYDGSNSVSSIKYSGASGFIIGGNDGWGTKNVSIPGSLSTGVITARSDVVGNDAFPLRLQNGASSPPKAGTSVGISFDTIGRGPGVRDAEIRAINNGSNQVSLVFYTCNADAPKPAMTIDPLGGVLVQGKLKAADIVTAHLLVAGNWWADHVFDDGYRLMPLSEVKAFVREHGHLPEIPDAAAIKRDGIAVDDMLARHMQKIEELTLHAITQEEIIQSQATVIAQQKSALADLSARLAAIELKLAH